MSTIQPVILAGGPGARLWPLSNAARPKPFLKLDGAHTLLDRTIERLADPALFASPVIACAAANAEAAGAALEAAGAPRRLILEPEPRDTAAAIAAIAAARAAENPDELVLIVPADHTVGDIDAFRRGCALAAEIARKGRLVLFGAAPNCPHEGYGYIEAASDAETCDIVSFHEKPDAETAAAFLASGAHLWNMGMFLAPASVFLAMFESHAPDILGTAQAAVASAETADGALKVKPDVFASARKAAFDRAVVEKVAGAAVVRLSCDWSDVGAWDAVFDTLGKDEAGNAAVGDAHLIGARDTLVHANGLKIAAIGVEGLAIVSTPEGVLVCRRDQAQRVKELTEALKGS
ncbi:MAG: sugar phosphate nucleotidyltransferase [Maricaulaceae bacterium]|jgi:mannose-1-phosphate guanylyltransferase/mannose-1-phosphate guanylyltransferase/mannose-6-phosphate isomerase